MMIFRRVVLWMLPALWIATSAAAEELTLARAVELALTHNFDLRAATQSAAAADWDVVQGASAWLPKASWSTTWTHLDEDARNQMQPQGETGTAGGGATGQYSWSDNYSSAVTITQPIFNGGTEWASIRSAQVARDQAHLEEADRRLQTVRDVRQAYYAAVKAQALRQVAGESLALARESLTLVRARFGAGLAVESDVLRWEAEVSSAEGSAAETESDYEIAVLDIAQLIGVAVDQDGVDLPEMDWRIGEDEEAAAARIAETEVGSPLFGTHPAWRLEDEAVTAVKVEEQRAIGGLLPSVNATFQYAWPMSDTLALEDEPGWTVGVAVTIPLFQGLGAAAGIGSSRHRLQAQRIEAENGRRRFAQQTRAAALKVRTTRLRAKAAGNACAQAEANLKLVRARVAVGKATNLELLDAQVSRRSAQSDLIGAVSDFRIALADWDYYTARES